MNRDRRLLLNVGCHKLTINDVKIFRNLEFSRLCIYELRRFMTSQTLDWGLPRGGISEISFRSMTGSRSNQERKKKFLIFSNCWQMCFKQNNSSSSFLDPKLALLTLMPATYFVRYFFVRHN